MADLFGIGAAIGGIAQGAFSYAGTKATNKANLKIARETNEQNQSQWQQEFDYNKYLNENQHQIESKDLLAAGINPIVGAGGQLQSFTANPNTAVAPTMQAPDFSGLAQVGSALDSIANREWQSDENQKNRDTQEYIAELQAASQSRGQDVQERIADKNREEESIQRNKQRAQEYLIHKEDNAIKSQIADLDRSSRESVAHWANQVSRDVASLQSETSKWLQTNAQDYEISERHFQHIRRVQTMITELQDTLDHNRDVRLTLQNMHDRTGRNIASMLADAQVAMMEFMTDPDQRKFQNAMQAITTATGAVNATVNAVNTFKKPWNTETHTTHYDEFGEITGADVQYHNYK